MQLCVSLTYVPKLQNSNAKDCAKFGIIAIDIVLEKTQLLHTTLHTYTKIVCALNLSINTFCHDTGQSKKDGHKSTFSVSVDKYYLQRC
jgi:hypothetical protein